MSDSIHTLTQVKYLSDNIGYFPLLGDVAYFSWGKGVKNMSFQYGKSEHVAEHINEFYSVLQINPQNVIYMLPEHKDNIAIVTKEDECSEDIPCDCLITKTKRPLAVLPADCPCMVIVGKDKKEEDVIALVHVGRKGIDLGLAKKAISFIKSNYGCKEESIYIGIIPNIAQVHYEVEKEILTNPLWDKFSIPSKNDGKVYLDLLGCLLEQLDESNILKDHIICYKVDTYESAQNGECFSHRLATYGNHPEMQGRIIFAVKLPPTDFQPITMASFLTTF